MTARTVETDVPARMDRLPWARWHWLVLAGLGFAAALRHGLATGALAEEGRRGACGVRRSD